MTYSVFTTPEFDARLEEAIGHRIEHYGMRSARKLLDDFETTAERLASAPFIGAIVEDAVSSPRDDALRWVRLSSYIATYRVHTAGERVVLLGLFYATSNWRKRVL